MNRPISLILAIGLMGAMAWGAGQSQTSPAPLVRAHAHNDYEHKRPLLDALDHGFCSVEADIYLIGGQLLVAHDRDKVTPERTLQALYLDPLRQRARQNDGRIHRNGPTMILLVDIKSEAEATYAVLREQLKQYSDIVTTFSSDKTETKALTVIVSGNRPRKTMAEEPVRYAALDGRLADLNAAESKHFIPLISDNWSLNFKWRGLGPFPEEEQSKLEQIVQKAHQQGRKVRFWAAPDQALGWKALLAAKVDLINTDNLDGLKEFLLANDR